MTTKSEPLDRLILLRLALEGGLVKNTDFKPELKKPDRDRLVAAGLMETEKRAPGAGGRKVLHLNLTERGWGWLVDHLAGELPARANAVRPLQKLLGCLKAYLDDRGVSLAEFLTRPSTSESRLPLGEPEGDEQRIERAYYQLSGGRPNERVRLAALRAELPDIPRERLDVVLLAMATRGGVALYPLENPLEIGPQDREAVLRTPSGHERHLIYLGGTPS
jgi:hypothetical protein